MADRRVRRCGFGTRPGRLGGAHVCVARLLSAFLSVAWLCTSHQSLARIGCRAACSLVDRRGGLGGHFILVPSGCLLSRIFLRCAAGVERWHGVSAALLRCSRLTEAERMCKPAPGDSCVHEAIWLIRKSPLKISQFW